MFKNVLAESMVKIAQSKNKTELKVHNIRDWTGDKHKTADDKPYGGGPGMVMKIEPIYKALVSIIGKKRVDRLKCGKPISKDIRVILLSPRGRLFNQAAAKALCKTKRLVLICGHYEGVDERVRKIITDEISIGDYVLTGGEIPAMVVLDAVIRLIPGVLGDKGSLKCESFENNLLEYPHYTRPRQFEGMKVPEVLLSGNHEAIYKWRRSEAIKRTKTIRSDLWKKGNI